MTFLNLSKEIYDAIYEALESGYYNEEDLECINFCEIRNWVGLEYIDPIDPNYTADDKSLDNYIIKICEALKSIIEIFGTDQEV